VAEREFLVEGIRARRIGLPEAEYHVEDQALPTPPGQRVRDLVGKLKRTASMGVKGVPPSPSGSAFTSTWRDVDLALAAASELLAYYAAGRNSRHSPGYDAQCHANLIKLILQRGYPPGFHYKETLVVPGNAGPAPKLVALLRDWVAARYSRAAAVGAVRIKRGTNHGLPDGRKDDESLLAHMAEGWLLDSAATFSRRWVVQQGIFGFRMDTEFPPALQGTRPGYKTKEQKIVRAGSDGPRLVGRATSLFPDRRLINMTTAQLNTSRLRILVTGVKLAIRSHPTFGHGPAEDVHRYIWSIATRIGAGVLLLPDDPSRFDINTSDKMMIAAESVYDPHLPALNLDKSLIDATRRIPVLAGPLWAGDDAFLYERQGTILSGVITTSVEGTLVNFLRVMMGCAAGFHITPEAAFARWERGEFGILVWGDDTLIIVPKTFDYAAYIAASAELGYETKEDVAPVFLMRYHGRADRVHNLGARAFMHTVFREHSSPHLVVELVGLLARLKMIEGAPDYEVITQLLFSRLERLRAEGIRGVPDLERRVSQEVRALPDRGALTELQALALSWAQGEDFWADSARAEYLVRATGIAGLLPNDRGAAMRLGPPEAESDVNERWARIAAKEKTNSAVADEIDIFT